MSQFESGVAHIGPMWGAQVGPTTFCLMGPHGTHLGTPTWAFPCWSQLRPIFILTWDTSGHSHLGTPMLVPIGTHLYFHMGHTWAFSLGHSHVGPNWDPSLFSHGTHLIFLLNFYRYIPNETHRSYCNEILKLMI